MRVSIRRIGLRIGLAALVYILCFFFLYILVSLYIIQGGPFLTMSPLPDIIDVFVVFNLPGVALAGLILLGKFNHRYIVPATAVMVSTLVFWSGVIIIGPFPIPETAYEQAAARVGLKNCGVYRTNPGLNTITFDMNVTAGTRCYILILRPEPRNQYVLHIRTNGWASINVVKEESVTNSFYAHYDLMPAGITFLWSADTGRIGDRIQLFIDGSIKNNPRDFLGFGNRYRDDYIFYFVTKAPDDKKVTLNVKFYAEVNAIWRPFP